MPVLGLDLGGTKLLAIALDDRGDVRFRLRVPTGRSFGPDAAIDAIDDLADQARQVLGAIDAVGIGFPGLVEHHRGVARSTPMLDGWHDVDLAARLAARLDVPCAIDNDVNAAALYEHACRGARDFLYVSVGTGIGGALVLGGELWRGTGGFSGEIGHLSIDHAGPACACGRRGCVHLYASGTAIEVAAELARGRLTAQTATDRKLAAVRSAAGALGVAIGSALNLVDVPLVVIGGGVAEIGALYIDAVAARARSECFPEIGQRCAIEAARGGYDAGALGAAMLARPSIFALAHPRSAATRSSSTA